MLAIVTATKIANTKNSQYSIKHKDFTIKKAGGQVPSNDSHCTKTTITTTHNQHQYSIELSIHSRPPTNTIPPTHWFEILTAAI